MLNVSIYVALKATTDDTTACFTAPLPTRANQHPTAAHTHLVGITDCFLHHLFNPAGSSGLMEQCTDGGDSKTTQSHTTHRATHPSLLLLCHWPLQVLCMHTLSLPECPVLSLQQRSFQGLSHCLQTEHEYPALSPATSGTIATQWPTLVQSSPKQEATLSQKLSIPLHCRSNIYRQYVTQCLLLVWLASPSTHGRMGWLHSYNVSMRSGWSKCINAMHLLTPVNTILQNKPPCSDEKCHLKEICHCITFGQGGRTTGL